MSAADNITASRKSPGRPRGYIADYRPQARTLPLLDATKAVLDEYREHWPLTVRQIFYRLVGAYGFPKTEAFYAKLCHHLANARRGGVILFDAIRDDGVTTVRLVRFDDEDHFRQHVRAMAGRYQRNLMAAQPRHVEVWCEAAGMIHQLAAVTHRYSINVYSSSGFDSLTAKKVIADRICAISKPAVILHLGDYDPSGESIFRSVAEDVCAFVAVDRPHGLVNVEFKRVALTAEQVRNRGLPTAPAKATDSRSKGWHGETCQLEALTPKQIADILDDAICELVEPDLILSDMDREEVERDRLTRLLLTGPEVTQ